MPYCEFYGLVGESLARSVEKVQRICADRDTTCWGAFVEQLELIRRVPGIEPGFAPAPFRVEREPLARVEWHTNQPPLPRDTPLASDAPALSWLLTELTLLTANIRLEGWDDRFNWTFADGLGIEERYTSEPDRAEFRLWVDRLFLSDHPIDPPFSYLSNPDAYTAFLPNAELGNLLGVEEQTGLLARVVADLRGSDDRPTRRLGDEIARILHFLHVVRLGHLDLYYRVYRT